jgi:hypothetical protein
MDLFISVYCASLPYLILIVCIFSFFVLYKWAKKRKAAAIGIGMMMHVLMPVPNADNAIKQVMEKKQVKQNISEQKKVGKLK